MTQPTDTPPPTRPAEALPAWLLLPQAPPPAAGRSGVSFLSRFVQGMGRFLEEAFAGEALSARPGLLQGLDARAKIVGLLALVVTAALTTDLTAWYGAGSLVAVIVPTAMAVYGFRVVLAGRSLLGYAGD